METLLYSRPKIMLAEEEKRGRQTDTVEIFSSYTENT